jgi:PAS domain S-box-containing protein
MSSEHCKQVTAFPLLRSESTIVDAVIAIVRRLSKAHSLPEVMEIVTHAARTLLHADGVTFVLRDGDRCYYAEEDAISPLWKGSRFPATACISGWCMTERQAVAIPDIYQDSRIPIDAYSSTFVQSLAMVPVREDDPIAAIGAYWSHSRNISPAELELLQTVANSAALAIAKIELEQDRLRIRALIEQASDGIFVANLDGRYVDVNEAGCRMLGYSRAEILTMTIMDLILPQEKERLLSHRERFLTGGTDVGEWMLRRKDGTYFHAEVSAKIFADGRWQAITRDISERKRVEEALRLSEAAAKRALQARDEMLAIVAHDLRNPLAAIAVLATVLQMSDATRETGNEIAHAADRMGRLIRELVDVNLMEAGTFVIRHERVVVHKLLSEVLTSQSPLASSASLSLRLEAEPMLPDLWADHNRMLQVFENLLGNAVKFTRAGGQITLGAKADAENVLFFVADTGRGIDGDHLPRVFDRYWQARHEDRAQGVGLGLPIVRGIVEAHGGRIWVESSPGQGSTFSFAIPVVTEASRAT